MTLRCLRRGHTQSFEIIGLRFESLLNDTWPEIITMNKIKLLTSSETYCMEIL